MGKRKKGPLDPDKDAPTSLFILSATNPIRRIFVWFVSWPPFEYLIILTIIANCVVMSMDTHLPNGDKTILALQLEELEPVFMGIFTVEMCTKILAMGLVLHPDSYLRNPWNIMDFVVVVSGFLPLLMPKSGDGKATGPDLTTLRTFRVLRPLKLVSGVPSLQVVMSAIAKAIGPLVNIALLLLFAIIIFAIIGLEFYAGALNKTCYDLQNLDVILTEVAEGMPCTEGTEDMAAIGAYTCSENTSVCLQKWVGPNNGITSFDNIGLAALTVFQCVTMEGWTPILYWTNDAIGSVFNWVFFLPLIVVGSFFMLNLVLGVLSGEFAKEKERVESRAGFMALKEQQKLEKELTGYVEWICRAEDLVLAEERTTEADRELIMEARKKQTEKLKKLSKLKADSVASSVDDDGLSAEAANKELWKKEKQLRFYIRRSCKTPAWFWFVIVLVFLNTCTVAIEHYNQPVWLTEFLFYAEFVFLALFVFEMGIRMYALGLAAYFSSAFNRFDCIVIVGSILEVLWVNFRERAGSFGLSALRALRLLRVFKVTKYWSSLRNLVVALMNAISSILSLLLLLFLFIFIFALLGMQLFGGQFNFPEGRPTSNFDSITSALLTVFQVLTGEDWNVVMYTAINSKGGRYGGGIFYSCYFVMLTLCGDYTLLNVFLAIACDSLDQAAALTEAEEAEKERQAQELEKQREREALAMAILNGTADKFELEKREKEENEAWVKKSDTDLEAAAKAAQAEDEKEIPILPYSSLFILSSQNKIREVIHWFVTKKLFDNFIMLVIAVSSISLASEDPVDEDSPRNVYLGMADYFFTAIFTFEVCLKILDQGFILHPGAFMRDFWNVMDITVVTCALVSFYHTIAKTDKRAGTPTGQKLKSIKLLRVLRPLKTINRIPKLKAVFDCVIISLKNVFNILVVYILFQFIFAVIGVQLFNGKFFYCTDESKHDAQECQGQFFHYVTSDGPPVVYKREWARRSFHYDNAIYAMLTLFAVQTSEGWVAILQDSMASTYEDEGPIPWYRTEQAIFYIVFFIVFPFFFVNIFVALIIVTFNELGEAELEDDMDKNQKSCIDFAIQAKPIELYVPEEQTGLRYHIWRLVTSAPFENFILLLIILNTLLLMLKFEGAPLMFMDVLIAFNMVFTLLFTIECILKLSSFGPKNYFRERWNTFDFITVVGSIIDATKFVNVGFLRLFRAARLIKLLRRSVSVRILLYTFIQSFKALPYVCMLMGILFFIYAIIGMQLFGSLIMDPNTAIERHNNFRHIFQSLLLLFRCATGEAWPDIMLAGVAGRPCDARAYERNETTGELLDPDQTCGSNMTYLYFVSFIFLCSFIMLNLFVAVIMDNFDYLTRDSSILGSHHLGEFITAWADFDPSGGGTIHYTEALELLKNIDPPLGFGKKCPDKMAYKRLIRMNMPIDKEGRVSFTTTLFALIRDNLKINVRESAEMDQADLELRATIMKVWPVTRAGKIDLLVPTEELTGPGKLTVGKLYGGILIYEIWKTTRFSNLEILAKMEQEMATRMEKEGLNTGEGEGEENLVGPGAETELKLLEKEEKVDLNKSLEDEKRDTFNDTVPDNRQYQQRNGGPRLRRRPDLPMNGTAGPGPGVGVGVGAGGGGGYPGYDDQSWSENQNGWDNNQKDWYDDEYREDDWGRRNGGGGVGEGGGVNYPPNHPSHPNHRKLPQTPRQLSMLNGNKMDGSGSQGGGAPQGGWNNRGGGGGGIKSNMRGSDSGKGQNGVGYRGVGVPHHQQQDMYNGYTPHGKPGNGNLPNGSATNANANNTNADGTYSSHPNLVGNGRPNGLLHRRLPPLPAKPSVLKFGQWRQSSLPEEHNPPGFQRNHEPLQPSERHNFNKATSDMPPPPAPSGPGGDRSRRMKPMTPTKPSTLSFRQSQALNGSPNYGIFGATQFQMPKVNSSPTCFDTGGGVGGGGSGRQANGGVPGRNYKTGSLGRALPETPPPPAPSGGTPLTNKLSGAIGNFTGIFNRSNQDVDWI